MPPSPSDDLTEAAEAVQRFKVGIAAYAALYQECIDLGLPPEVAAHYIKLLMGQEAP